MNVQSLQKSIVVAISLTIVLYHISTLSLQYLKYETKVKIELGENHTMALPAFTICFKTTEMFHVDKILRSKPEWTEFVGTYDVNVCLRNPKLCYKRSKKLRQMMRYESGNDMRRNLTFKQIHRMTAMISELFA